MHSTKAFFDKNPHIFYKNKEIFGKNEFLQISFKLNILKEYIKIHYFTLA